MRAGSRVAAALALTVVAGGGLLTAEGIGGPAGVETPTPAAPPSIQKIEMNVGHRATVSRPHLSRTSIRTVWVTGPWLDYASSVSSSGGVSGSIQKKRTLLGAGELEIRLSASSSVTRGVKTLSINISCPPIPFTDCRNGPVGLPVFVVATGPIQSITPNGVVSPGQVMDFTLRGSHMNVARFVDSESRIISRTATTLIVRRRTPSCGEVRFYLYDQASGSWWSQTEQYALAPGYVHAHVGQACLRGLPSPPPTGTKSSGTGCPPYCER